MMNKDPKQIVQALSDEEVKEMFEKEHSNPGYVEDTEPTAEDCWDGDETDKIPC